MILGTLKDVFVVKIRVSSQEFIHTYTHILIHILTHTHKHTPTQIHTHTLTHAHTHDHTHTHTCTHNTTHSHRHTHTPTHIDLHIFSFILCITRTRMHQAFTFVVWICVRAKFPSAHNGTMRKQPPAVKWLIEINITENIGRIMFALCLYTVTCQYHIIFTLRNVHRAEMIPLYCPNS